MTTTTPAISVASPSGNFEQVTIERRDLRDDDILIDIEFAGICHSDIHQVREEWGEAIFPMVPGHEIAGTVSAVGSGVTKVKVGDRVGVGCMVDSCGECEMCKNGEEQFCTKGAVMTYNGRDYDGEPTYGGYSQQIVVSERFACTIPEGISLDVAAPLLCAGITTYAPLKRWGAGPGKRVGIIGVGGLGHLGVKIAAAMGAEVITLSRSDAKADSAKELGATRHVATSDESALKELKGSFDLILNTVSADLPMEDYLALLKPFGALISVGLPTKNYSVAPGSLIGGSKVMGGSVIGGIAETQEMLDFCAEHGIGATIETISADEVDEAYDKVVAGDVRYRYVIDVSTITPSA
ncbi:NAD(P)-dependent alcohol dehydrogenase [Calidifontibacter sp. DB0510]|uniref:alcohol dehydrogenase (NADP(+)) n=1 Tax=Metallococcus carri TaxID=1656884 RepID=A0A967B839_9MICO|nr:NAD(P)-dependent alcohol dehydrogenase [Metallococcus carri]NHN57327.1 NAD(P)-dependent alcohol dehydrogenase [Metallococcus carri]NOP38068.1 NAD(P)-dependent alcohol dehydrogenase [Calidifontibacter sp. DB2511S]